MKQKYVIGVDISKKKVDIAVMGSSYEIIQEKIVPNTEEKLLKFFAQLLGKLKVNADELLVCCEETGIYSKPMQKACTGAVLPLWVETAFKIKKASTDFRGKSDKKDAIRIAEYAWRYSDKKRLYSEPASENRDLQTLLNARETLLLQITQLKQQLNESKEFDKEKHALLKTCFQKPLLAMKKQLQGIEKLISELVNQNQGIKKNVELLKSIPGIGMQNALQFIVYTRNFTAFQSVNHLACYAGVAPFPNESGTIIKKARVSGFANKKLKKLLHMAAMASIRATGDLKSYFIRKVKEGKCKMLVLNNIRNKLIKRMFAVVKRETPYVSNKLETGFAN
jgi:transposase